MTIYVNLGNLFILLTSGVSIFSNRSEILSSQQIEVCSEVGMERHWSSFDWLTTRTYFVRMGINLKIVVDNVMCARLITSSQLGFRRGILCNFCCTYFWCSNLIYENNLRVSHLFFEQSIGINFHCFRSAHIKNAHVRALSVVWNARMY